MRVELRGLPLSERKRDLRRQCRKSRVPFMREVQTFPNGTLLFDHCSKFGFEGVVSKHKGSPYSSGPSRNWVKTKCPGVEAHQLGEVSPGWLSPTAAPGIVGDVEDTQRDPEDNVATANSPPANLLSIVVALNPTIPGFVAVPVVVALG